MKSADVQAIVTACAERAHARVKAANLPDQLQALRIELEALHAVVEALSDALLRGTSADPEKRR